MKEATIVSSDETSLKIPQWRDESVFKPKKFVRDPEVKISCKIFISSHLMLF